MYTTEINDTRSEGQLEKRPNLQWVGKAAMASSGGGGIQFDPAELEQEPYDPGKC